MYVEQVNKFVRGLELMSKGDKTIQLFKTITAGHYRMNCLQTL